MDIKAAALITLHYSTVLA